MATFRGYEVREERVAVADHVIKLLSPADWEQFLDDSDVQARFAQDEYMPYWATIWPAALLLAQVVGEWPEVHIGSDSGPCSANFQRPASAAAVAMSPARAAPLVLELGCGLGLVGLVAALRGYRVLVSDYDEDAVAFAGENARLNGLTVDSRRLDWRQTCAELKFDRIVAADVLYEARNLEPVAKFIAAHLDPGGFALLSDPNRGTADRFAEAAMAEGLSVNAQLMEIPPQADVGPSRATARWGRIFELRHGGRA